MSCQANVNSTWDAILDYEIVYTGQGVAFAGYVIRQNENLSSIIEKFAQAIKYVDTKDYYEPYVLIDDAVAMDLTGEQLNARYPNAPVTGVIYNTDGGYQYTKISAINWKFEIIEIR